jgi:hypothetical protein
MSNSGPDSMLTIINPDGTLWSSQGIVIGIDSTEDAAKQQLMEQFARTLLGVTFLQVKLDVVWHLWNCAQENGYRFRSMEITMAPPVTEPAAAAA